LLEVARLFPSDAPDFDDIDLRDDIASGRQIMMQFNFDGFTNYQMFREFFGGEIVFKGFPDENRNGNSFAPLPTLAITSASENKEGAWSFIRSLMTEQWQRQMIIESPNYIPSNKAVLDWMIDRAMNQEEHTVGIGTSFGGNIIIVDVKITPVSQTEMNQFMEMINSALQETSANYNFTAIMNMVSETASDYFSGVKTAEEVARIIQSRASILASEQFG